MRVSIDNATKSDNIQECYLYVVPGNKGSKKRGDYSSLSDMAQEKLNMEYEGRQWRQFGIC